MDKSKAVVPYLRKFDEDELNLLRTMLAQVAPKATGDEKRMFLYAAQKKGLDPFDKQIYLVPRWDSQSNSMKHSVQVSIDGLRLMAQRSGKYAGQIGPHWCGKDRVWHDVWIEDEPPVAARVGILRHDFKEPLFSIALFESYKQTKKDGSLNVFWQKYGAHMAAKCAEALAIRRAFPEETSGFYIPEEMGNPELVYVAEVEQDNNAPIAESEIVDAHQATRATPTDDGTTPHATSRSTNGATQPTNNNGTTQHPTPNETQQSGNIKASEGQSPTFTGNSHDPVGDLKNKAIKQKFIEGKDKTELAERWRQRLRAICGREVTDEELKGSLEMQTKVREAIERYVQQRNQPKPEPLTGNAVELAKEYRAILDRKADGKYATDQDAQRAIDIGEEMHELGYQINAQRQWVKEIQSAATNGK